MSSDDLLPDQNLMAYCEQQYGLAIDSVFLSPPPMSGDLWGLLPVDDTRLALFCADVCGHGTEVAPHTRFLHALLHASGQFRAEPAKMLRQLNAYLHFMLPRGQFAGIFYAVIDVLTDKLTYACSTFMPPLLRSYSGAQFSPLGGEGFPLGFLAEVDFDEHTSSFPAGAGLVIYSDAVVETPLPPKARFDSESLCAWVNALPPELPPAVVNKTIVDELDLGIHRLSDDLTIVSLFRR